MSILNKHKRTFRLDISLASKSLAETFMQAEKAGLPIILENKATLNPLSALLLVTKWANELATGKTDMADGAIIGMTALLVELWKKGLFIPSPDYPWTLEETLAYREEAQS